MPVFGLNVLAKQAPRIGLMVSDLGCLYEVIGLSLNVVLKFGSFLSDF